MVLVSLYLIYLVWRVIQGGKKLFWFGVGIGIFLVLLLLFMMGWYYSTHPDAYKILLDTGWQGLELKY